MWGKSLACRLPLATIPTMPTSNALNGHDRPVTHVDVAIIGAGPIGLELAVNLKLAGLSYVQFDAKQIGHTMTWWPRNTSFFSTTERLAIAGVPIQNNTQNRITGEDYLAYLRGIVEQFDLRVNAYEPVISAEKRDNRFHLTTAYQGGERLYSAENVVLAIGDMEWPNTLNIPGEDLPHVSHYFRDPHDYFRKRLLIVGGRNSAAEAALRCWRAGADVTLSYRRKDFSHGRIKHWLLPDLEAQFEAGTIRFLPETVPVEITESAVTLLPTADGKPIATASRIKHDTDFVLLATGFRGDQSLLRMLGVQLNGDNCVPTHDLATMETNVAGVYLCGTVAAGVQQRYTLFIENCHEHAQKITRALTGRDAQATGSVAVRNYAMPFERYQDN